MRNFLFYYKRTVKSPVFWVCTLIQAFLLLYGCRETLGEVAYSQTESVLELFRETTYFGIATVVSPFLCSIPFLFYQNEESRVGQINPQLFRTGRRGQIIGRFLAAAASGLTENLMAAVLFTIGACALGASWQPNEALISNMAGSYYWELLHTSTWQVYLLQVMGFGLYGIPWVLIGLIGSYALKDKKVVICLPFMVSLITNYLHGRIHLLWIGSPYIIQMQIKPIYSQYANGFLIALGYVSAIVVCCFVCYVWLFYRRWNREGL